MEHNYDYTKDGFVCLNSFYFKTIPEENKVK